MKLAVIGAGSTYTPELVSGLLRERERIDVGELVLHDIDAERREVVGGLAPADPATRQGYPRRARAHRRTRPRARRRRRRADPDPRRRAGGAAAATRRSRAACGCVGQETTGAGGLAKALRTVPVVLEIAERARELAADDAWIVDFTNPVGIVTRALLDAGHRAVGLCNVAINFQRQIAAHARRGRPSACSSTRSGSTTSRGSASVWLDGRDVLADVLDAPRRRAGARDRAAARGCSTSSARSRPTTCATSTPSARCVERAADEPAARADRRRDRARAARALPRSRADREAARCSSSAAARSTARPRPSSSPR